MRFLLFSVLLFSLALVGCGGGGDNGGGGASRPTITGISPNLLNPGTENIEGRIYGTNLTGVSAVQMGDGVIVKQYSGLSATEVYIYISVLREAPPGPRTVSVVTSAGVAQSSGTFSVGDNALPEARFKVTPPIGYKDTMFRFDGSGSYDPDGSIVNYQWHFGDGGNRNGRVVEYRFQRAGSFPVRLTVTDNRGGTHTSERFMDIDRSKAPIARMNVSPTSGTVSTVFRFDGSGSHDPDGRVTGYNWSFGDGKSARGMVVEHKYASASTYSASLSVSDNTGQSGQVSGTIRVDSAPGPPPPPGDDDDGGGGGGGGGGSCDANNFNTNFFTVVAVSGNTITADQAFRECPGLCGEVRRPGATGIHEFVGDIVSINGVNITFNPASLPLSTRPEPGERLNIVWRGCGG